MPNWVYDSVSKSQGTTGCSGRTRLDVLSKHNLEALKISVFLTRRKEGKGWMAGGDETLQCKTNINLQLHGNLMDRLQCAASTSAQTCSQDCPRWLQKV